LFTLTSAARRYFPTADGPLLRQLVSSLEHTMPEAAFVSFLKRIGADLATHYEAEFAGVSPEKRLKVAIRLLTKLGGAAEVQRGGEGTAIQGRYCPLANLVPAHPSICAVAQGFLERVLGQPVAERCDKSPDPCCRFELTAA
jgi:predicted ArsR family transcriptional regulator